MDLLNPLNLYLVNEIHQDLLEAEDEMEAVEAQRRGVEKAAYRNPFEELSGQDFVRRFRVTKDLARFIVNCVTPFIEAPTRSSALSIERKVLVALRFFASGSYQEITGSNIFTAMSQSSVSVSVNEVATALNHPTIFNEWVHFPANIEELQNLRRRFSDKYGLPGIVGLIDCTHVAIACPTQDPEFPEHAYVNRKGYHSINVQLVCDENLMIYNVNARYPGSVHDARIWSDSNVSRAMEQLHRNNPEEMYYLIGDSGYPLRPWLQTPVRNPEPGTPEERFNALITSIRSGIERCNGVLKNRFRCLLKDRVLHYRPDKASIIINACVLLHNMCIQNNIDLVYDHEPEGLGQHNVGNLRENANIKNPDLEAGRALRNHIIQQYFRE